MNQNPNAVEDIVKIIENEVTSARVIAGEETAQAAIQADPTDRLRAIFAVASNIKPLKNAVSRTGTISQISMKPTDGDPNFHLM